MKRTASTLVCLAAAVLLCVPFAPVEAQAIRSVNGNTQTIANLKLRTTDATVTQIYAITIPTNGVVFAVLTITGAGGGAHAGYRYRCASRNLNGTVYTMGTQLADATHETDSAWVGPSCINGNVSGNLTSLSFNVAGKAATTIDWSGTIQIVTGP